MVRSSASAPAPPFMSKAFWASVCLPSAGRLAAKRQSTHTTTILRARVPIQEGSGLWTTPDAWCLHVIVSSALTRAEITNAYVSSQSNGLRPYTSLRQVNQFRPQPARMASSRIGRSSITTLLLLSCLSSTAVTRPAFLLLAPRSSTIRSMASSKSAGLADIGGSGRSSPSDQPPPSAKRDADKPLWLVQLDRALHRNGREAHSRYIQLATVGEEEGGDDGSSPPFLRPYVRTVVYRGVYGAREGEGDGGQVHYLKMITDARSEKMGHLARFPHAEIAWYFTKSREQFRIFGTITVVSAADPDAALQGQRRHQWSCLSDNAKVQFLWPHPKQPLPDRETKPSAELDALFNPPLPEEASKTPPDTFCLLLFRPVRVDHLELKANPQRRTLHTWQQGPPGAWATEPVNP